MNQLYLEQGTLKVQTTGRGYAWFDTGAHESMLQACQLIQTIQRRQGLMLAAPEEAVWRQHWIDDSQLAALARPLAQSSYGPNLLRLLAEKAEVR